MKVRRQIIAVLIGIAATWVVSTNNRAQEPAILKEASGASMPVVTQVVSAADTIVVSATRIPQAIRDIGVSVSVIPRERIKELNAQNVAEVLEEVTDARVNSYGSFAPPWSRNCSRAHR